MPASGAAGAAAEADGGAAGGGAAPPGGGAPPPAPADAQRVRVPQKVPGFVSREGLRTAVEEGGAQYSPLYLWTAEAREAEWSNFDKSKRRNLSNRFNEHIRVRAARAPSRRLDAMPFLR